MNRINPTPYTVSVYPIQQEPGLWFATYMIAEYRNGGLFVDAGVLEFRDPTDAGCEHDVASLLVVEWRALTVALLDRLADLLRQRVGLDAVSLPLAKILEGGTWAAGRAMAIERRPDGSPPVKVVSDGTVF